jgi:periplasmic divalent cation tolerance protein
VSDFQIIYLTCSSKEEANNIAKGLLEHSLIACANVLGDIESHFKWQAEIQNEKEVAMILKTNKASFSTVEKYINENHSYDCPCVIAIDIANLSSAFEKYLVSSLS